MRLPKQSQFPKTLQVSDEVYKIQWVRAFKGHDNQVGECCWTDKIIRIKLGQTPSDRLKTFIHEVIHAYECEFGLKMPHKLVYQMEEALFQFLMENL